MEVMKIMFIISITMALCLTLTMKSINEWAAKPPHYSLTDHPMSPTTTAEPETTTTTTILPSRSLSRFLAEDMETIKNRNPRSASQCRKNKKLCEKKYGKKWKCCNNKCKDLSNDKNNCGGCKKKCKYTEECCRGKCVDVAYDKRHCGQCNRRCQRGKFCVYGMCEYA